MTKDAGAGCGGENGGRGRGGEKEERRREERGQEGGEKREGVSEGEQTSCHRYWLFDRCCGSVLAADELLSKG